jgi:cell shape-determining protein MreD
METLTLIILITYPIVGVVACLMHTWYENDQLTLSDLLMGILVGSLSGYVGALMFMIFSEKFRSIVIFRRKHRHGN